MRKYVFNRKLPKASFIRIRTAGKINGSRFFLKFRGANFMEIYIGPINITLRMPWLRSSAEALHPELFHK